MFFQSFLYVLVHVNYQALLHNSHNFGGLYFFALHLHGLKQASRYLLIGSVMSANSLT